MDSALPFASSLALWRSHHHGDAVEVDAAKIDGLIEIKQVLAGDQRVPRFEVTWKDQTSAEKAFPTSAFGLLGLSEPLSQETVIPRFGARAASDWLRFSFYGALLTAVVALFAQAVALSDAYHWAFGKPEGRIEIETEESLKPRAVGIPFRLGVTVHNSKSLGRIRATRPHLAVEPSGRLEVADASATTRVWIDPGKTEQFDFVITPKSAGPTTIRFSTKIRGGAWRLWQRMRVESVDRKLAIWRPRDSIPQLIFLDAPFPNSPIFEVVFRSSDPIESMKVAIQLPADAQEITLDPPRNASVGPQRLIPGPDATVLEFSLLKMKGLKEVRIPFRFTAPIPRNNDEWKNALDILVTAE